MFGWGWTAWHWPVLDLGRPVLAPGAELLVPAPYFLAVFALWAVYFPAERALHRTSAAVRSSAEPDSYWSPAGYVLLWASNKPGVCDQSGGASKTGPMEVCAMVHVSLRSIVRT